MKILLNDNGNLYGMDRGHVAVDPLNSVTRELFREILRDPYQHFFKIPFSSINYNINGEVRARFSAHPSSFYPGSPFDTFKAVRVFLQEQRVILPRMYIYPTSVCNSHCLICQFNFRRTSPCHIPWELLHTAIERFKENAKDIRTPSLIILGDGEPTLYPNFQKLLSLAGEFGIRVFLTTNWILTNKRKIDCINAVAQYATMITISIKGINKAAYDKYQGLHSGSTFDKVIRNIENLIERLNRFGRRSDVLVGVASLILPENTPSYIEMIKYFSSLGVDYVYFNLVEPSYHQWGISFTEEEVRITRDIISELPNIETNDTVVRYPLDPFNLIRETVYYDAQNRTKKDVCGSALWNPIIIPSEGDGILLSCRNSDNFNQPSFWYCDTLKDFSIEKRMGADAQERVMKATQGCRRCRLERQVKMFDQLIDIDSRYHCKGRFMLEFDITKLANRKSGRAIAFEDTL